MGSPSVPTAPSTGNAQNLFNTGLNSQFNVANQAQGYTGNILNNAYAPAYQSAANQAGAYLGNTLAPSLQTSSQNLSGAASAALPYGQSILQTGFDPQNQLYNRTQNQVQQQTDAQLAATGVGATPYGASVMAQSADNFNIDWQNNQEARQSQALSSYDSLLGSVGSAYGQAGALGTAASDATLAGGQLPYSTSNAINQTDVGALQTQQGFYAQPTNTAGNWVQSVYGDQMQQYNAQEQQNQSFWGDLGNIGGTLFGAATGGAGGLGGLFGGLFGGSSDPWAGAGIGG